ncbi:MAG: pyruvate flavodoxin/ferredoxin oxidoreductase domain protein [Dehalococcoidia bacterium]|nr:pyruvate flavodoxin/ferredoxin oxidoreductase domain protein [Dehalococcoidia bacterium]
MTMTLPDITWLIGGPQGSGINVAAEVFAKSWTRVGYRVIANIEFHSNIEGEHSYYRVRVSEKNRGLLSERVHVAVALDEESILGDHHGEFKEHEGHLKELVPGGVLVYDASIKLKRVGLRDDIHYVEVPYDEILRKMLVDMGRGSEFNNLRIIRNTVAVGASLAALGLDNVHYEETVKRSIRRVELGEINALAARAGFDYARETLGGTAQFDLPKVNKPQVAPLFIRGIEATGIAKIKAGLDLQTYYPISPSTDESVFLEIRAKDFDMVVVQMEDEVASINAVVGAAHAGARSATSTSGPGFSLMAEGMGFASLTESAGPVVFLWQRGGPSTGLPTRFEQADLRFALQPGHGEFSHIVVAPGDIQEIIEDSYEVFNWTDRYQLPAVVMLDKSQSSGYSTVDELKFDHLPPIDRGARFVPNGDYLRYEFTETGISPRANPGGKLALADKEIPSHRKIGFYGPKDADVTLIAWGSVKPQILDALEILEREDGVKANFLQVRLLRPFPVNEVTEILSKAKRTILVEVNYSGQLGNLIREETGIDIGQRVLKFDGRPFSEEELLDGLRTALKTGDKRVPVSHLLP